MIVVLLASRVEGHLEALEERVRSQYAENERLLADLKSLFYRQRVVQPPVAGKAGAKVSHPEIESVGQAPAPAPAHLEELKVSAADDDSDVPVDQEGHRPPGPAHVHGAAPAQAVPSAPAAPPVPAAPEPKAMVPVEEKSQLEKQQADQQPPAPPPPPPPPSPPQKSPQELQAERLRTLAAGVGGVPAVAVLVLACNRVTVRKCLDQLLTYRPSPEHFPIIVSQDCKHTPTADALTAYGSRISLIQQPDQSEIDVPPREKKFRGYFNIARHYGWALNQTFFHFNFQTVIIVEDDLDVAPDFFEYFSATLPLLRRDPTLWCVSAWNDNGKAALVDENAADLLYRTDFFPGLGWMLTRETWAELAPKWPASISQTDAPAPWGACGHFYDKHLKYIKLSDKFVPFTQQDLSYLLKDNYDVEFVRRVYDSPVVTYQELRSGSIVAPGPVRIPYYTKDAFKHTAKMLGLMDDFRSGVPRTGYRGVVSFMYKGRRVYLAPNANWKAYDPSWS
ncbi:Alpha-1,3-mannosyl-glycoprotein 2-beta-N-acetylglucosaminyltransferase [Gryllus bimaculatus]|nr:Alpha-1,3-mannosyl-glycoprotein 2-beta-N-acetylglucosaminyltransferase [Gryllus bimaculatus]